MGGRPERADECRFARERFELFLDGDLDAHENSRVRLHLHGCEECGRWIDEDVVANDAILIAVAAAGSEGRPITHHSSTVYPGRRGRFAAVAGAAFGLLTAIIVFHSIGFREPGSTGSSLPAAPEVAAIDPGKPKAGAAHEPVALDRAVDEFSREVGSSPMADGRLVGVASPRGRKPSPLIGIDRGLHEWLAERQRGRRDGEGSRRLARDLSDQAPVLVQMIDGLLDVGAGEDALARVELIGLLETIGHPDVIEVLERATSDGAREVRAAALTALDRLGARDTRDHFLARAKAEIDPELRILAATAAIRRGSEGALVELQTLYDEPLHRAWRLPLVEAVAGLEAGAPLPVRHFLRGVLDEWTLDRGDAILGAVLAGLVRQNDAGALPAMRRLQRTPNLGSAGLIALESAIASLEAR